MSQQIEIEFKNLVTKKEFQQLCTTLSVTEKHFKKQINHYFETADWQLRDQHCGLRIREIDSYIECTLKEPSTTAASMLETTDLLTAQQAAIALKEPTLLEAPEVLKRLKHLNINIQNLQKSGTLSTTRAEINYKGGTLVFDHSQYADTEDFEIEYEVTDEQLGKKNFQQLLLTHNIPNRPTAKKIARFVRAIQSKGDI